MNTEISNDELLELLTLRIETDEYGDVRYFNSDDELHRIHGPAIIMKNGAVGWYHYGKHIETRYYEDELTIPQNLCIINHYDHTAK